MNAHMVIVNYNPGRPVIYMVTGAPDQDAAKETVLHSIGYHPGVNILAWRCDNFLPMVMPEFKLRYRKLTRDQQMAIRYND